MAQIDFFFTPTEAKQILAGLLLINYRLVFDDHYLEPNYTEVTNINELESLGYYNKQVFILHKDYSELPLGFRSFNKEGKTLHYISQREGGPTIDFFWPGKYPLENKLIAQGFLSLYTTYLHKGKICPVGEAAKNHYKTISKLIRNASIVKVVIDRRGYWVSQGVINLIEQGYNLSIGSQEILDKFYAQLPLKGKVD